VRRRAAPAGSTEADHGYGNRAQIPGRQRFLAHTGKSPATLASIRVRVSGDIASLNVKSMTLDVIRTEYEYPIPVQDAREILQHLCSLPLIEKTRHYVPLGRHVWEVDVFEGDNAGLVVAELELQSADEDYAVPDWIGTEVSGDPRYYNVNLAHTGKSPATNGPGLPGQYGAGINPRAGVRRHCQSQCQEYDPGRNPDRIRISNPGSGRT